MPHNLVGGCDTTSSNTNFEEWVSVDKFTIWAFKPHNITMKRFFETMILFTNNVGSAIIFLKVSVDTVGPKVNNMLKLVFANSSSITKVRCPL